MELTADLFYNLFYHHHLLQENEGMTANSAGMVVKQKWYSGKRSE